MRRSRVLLYQSIQIWCSGEIVNGHLHTVENLLHCLLCSTDKVASCDQKNNSGRRLEHILSRVVIPVFPQHHTACLHNLLLFTRIGQDASYNAKRSREVLTASSGIGPVKSIISTARISSESSIPASSMDMSGSRLLPWCVYTNDIVGTIVCEAPFIDILGVSPAFVGVPPFAGTLPADPVDVFPTAIPALRITVAFTVSMRSDHAVNRRESFVLREILKNSSARYLHMTLTTMSGNSRYLISCCFAFSLPLRISSLSALIWRVGDENYVPERDNYGSLDPDS